MSTGNRARHAVAFAALALLGNCVAADQAPGVAAAITSGKAAVALRYRYEFVDQGSFGDDASASTLRLRLNYETAGWQNWSGFVEFDYVSEVLLKDFNSGSGTSGSDRNRYPVVADPDGADLNQAYLQFAPGVDMRARLGRQRILLDDQRFVGGVGWRQNEQTYDALSVRYDGWKKTSVFYSYVANVARIFGSGVPAGKHEQNTHLLNVKVDLDSDLQVFGYAYLIDNDDAAALSTNTLGIRAEGGVKVGGGRLSLLGDFAKQHDAGNNPANFSADYHRLQAIWKAGAFSAGAGYEVLGSDNGQGFRTPLATLHAFNGWADQFLNTPSDGLEDFYLRVGYDVTGWSLQALYHDFTAEASSQRHGDEIDVSATRKLGERYGLLLKAAMFDGDAGNFDNVTKFWLMLSAQF